MIERRRQRERNLADHLGPHVQRCVGVFPGFVRQRGPALVAHPLMIRWASMPAACPHIGAIATVKLPQRRECEACVAIGAEWVHLRTCQDCGATLCCDSSPNRHASKHARASQHAVIASAEPGERWLYCFVDEAFGRY